MASSFLNPARQDPPIKWAAVRSSNPALILKRSLDFGGAAAALIFLLPAMALIALLIKLDSPGPVLYCAERAGRKGRLFRCYKFRTMGEDADELKAGLRHSNQRSGPF